jgi:DNA mismatch repair protein MutS
MSALLNQYKAIKAKYPDAVLLFRVGDYYEALYEDAEIVYKHLGITLCPSNDNDLKASASFPYHALDCHLMKLVKAGCRVAISEQLEDPKKAKGAVKRGVTDFFKP